MKLTPVIVCCVVALVFLSCHKDKFETKPRLEFISYNKIVDSPGAIRFRIAFFDKEGDLSEGPFTAIRIRLNNFPPAPHSLIDTIHSVLPKFPTKDNAEIDYQLDYLRVDEAPKNDTMRFKFAVTDKAGHNSDTLVSDVIVARKPS